MCTSAETEEGKMSSQKVELATMNDGLKEALFSCARDEIRKLVVDMLSPKHASKSTSLVSSLSAQTASRKMKKSSSYRKAKLLKQCSSNRSISKRNLRPMTACSLQSCTTSAYKPRRTKSYNKLHCSHERVLLSSEEGMFGESGKPESLLSFASTKWIEKSAKMIHKSSNEVCNVEATKTGKSNRRIDAGATKVGTPLSTLDVETKMNDAVSSRMYSDLKRPNSAYTKMSNKPRISTRNLTRPTTALERRAPLRPSTAHLVRAKTEDFSQKLLRPIALHSSKAISSPIPFAMDEHEWENELARHIVSVFNNKVVSDVQGSECPRQIADNVSKGSQLPSKSTQGFFSASPPPDVLDVGGIKNAQRLVLTDPPSKETILRQTKELMKSTTPRMVWLGGTGDTYHGWNELEALKNFNPKAIEKLHREGKYVKYILVLKSEICSMIASLLKESVIQQELLWRKLYLCAIGFASKLIEDGRYPQAIEILEIATDLLSTDYIQSADVSQELDGLLKDTHAYYYSRRGKPSAALQYIIGAANTEKQIIASSNKSHHDVYRPSIPIRLARCHLHRAYILQQLHRFGDAMKYMQRVLSIVDIHLRDDMKSESTFSVNETYHRSAKREIGADDPEIILLVAVTHHNIAVIQILMGHIGDACISSQNCRRLCRLCMSISSRYVTQFEETHMKALCEMSSMLRCKQTKEEALVFQKLVVGLFD